MNVDKAITIQADYMYLVFLGDDETIGKIVDRLNKNIEELQNSGNSIESKSYKTSKTEKTKQDHIYIKREINNPCIYMLDEEYIQKILTDDAIKQIEKLRLKDKNNNKIILESEIDGYKKYIKLDEGVETAQCLTYADVSSNDIAASKRKTPTSKLMMMLDIVKNDSYYTLSLPVLQLDEEENPDKLISKWLKDHNLKNIVRELTIRPVHIVGNEHDILVFSAFVNE